MSGQKISTTDANGVTVYQGAVPDDHTLRARFAGVAGRYRSASAAYIGSY